MIGQTSMEAAVLGGYVKRVLDLHPEAPIPGVYRAEGLFHDAVELRKTIGDAAFFEQLNRSVGQGGGRLGRPGGGLGRRRASSWPWMRRRARTSAAG